MPARQSNHAWVKVGPHRERCLSCRCIRSKYPSGVGWVYCQIGGDEVTRAPECMPTLPGVLGAAHVDGDNERGRLH